MTDHFEGIDKLVKEAPHTDGAPNFRRVSESWSQMGLINPTSKLQPWLILSHSRNLKRNVQGVPSGRGLGFADMDLGCSAILPGQ